jgi:hypothetical protein
MVWWHFKKYTVLLCTNMTVFLVIYTAIAGGISVFDSPNTTDSAFDINTVRSTYPNYRDYDPEVALSIFKEEAEIKTAYMPFTAYRRKGFKGTAVNVSDEHGFRRSINEALDNSVWFLGGSTMWGTGAMDEATIPSLFAELTGKNVSNLGEGGYSSFQELIQLQILLANGYSPAHVLFYDGVNDGYYSCRKNEPLPTHNYRSRYKQYSGHF